MTPQDAPETDLTTDPGPVAETRPAAPAPSLPRDLDRRLGDSYAIAILHWPAVIGCLAAPSTGWGLLVKIALGSWALLVGLSMILGRREAGTLFGSMMALCAVCVGAAWATAPGAWMYLWLALLVPCFYGAQRARFLEPAPGTSPAGATPDAPGPASGAPSDTVPLTAAE